MNDILEVRHLVKRFGDVTAVDDLSFRVREGELFAFLGVNGAGKSTIVNAVSRGVPYTGTVLFEGKDLTKLREKELAKIRLDEMGFIFQQMYMMKNLTILDNIVLPAAESKKSKESREEKQERGEQLMRKMGIIEIADNDINEVSGGQLQRACICRSMVNHPKLLFADVN